MQSTPWIVELVNERAGRLENYCEHILSCRVTIEMPHKHHHSGNHYRVKIDLSVPEHEIVVDRDPSKHDAAKDINAVLSEAFDSAKRQLQEYVRMRRGEIKNKANTPIEEQLITQVD